MVRIAAENAIVSTAGPPFSPEAVALFFILIIKALNEWQQKCLSFVYGFVGVGHMAGNVKYEMATALP